MTILFGRAAVLAILPLATSTLADDLIFADVLNPNDPLGNSIRRIRTDGSNLETLIATGGGVRGVDVDVAGNYIYWTDTDNFVIRRAHFDGSGQQDLVTTGLVFPSALRLSLPAGKIFWGDGSTEEMYYSQLDGSSPILMATTVFYRGLAVDEINSTVYWTTSSTVTTGRIMKSDFFGSNQQTVLGNPPISKPGNLAIDVAGGKLYWTNQITWSIFRSNLDGTNVEPLLSGSPLGPVKGLAIDTIGGKLYYGQDIDNEGFQFGEIYRMNLDGTLIELIATGLGSVNDIVFVREGGAPCYANCDGSTSTPVLSANDFLCFLNLYAEGSSLANCDGTTTPPTLSANDFLCFLNAFATGCS
jgi:DNA-binding beta-propeller fold protein YncE